MSLAIWHLIVGIVGAAIAGGALSVTVVGVLGMGKAAQRGDQLAQHATAERAS